jgi:hypothetical protein
MPTREILRIVEWDIESVSSPTQARSAGSGFLFWQPGSQKHLTQRTQGNTEERPRFLGGVAASAKNLWLAKFFVSPF